MMYHPIFAMYIRIYTCGINNENTHCMAWNNLVRYVFEKNI